MIQTLLRYIRNVSEKLGIRTYALSQPSLDQVFVRFASENTDTDTSDLEAEGNLPSISRFFQVQD